ncbi:hypothetical protein QWY86_10875 [Pedobacter aquatilis]|uniref:hypothetical protein n=1 Tax=Pedobacter aquatilis TaxID=351343 RepID=UPI0025B478FC|nr:hypothetical protein [Pedobacter aquatilis]MDN3587174.1 hypothetical protein [Pedobacter aquatilis]
MRNGITKSGEIWEWAKTGIKEIPGKPVEARDIKIALYAPETTICRWILKGAYPVFFEVASEQEKILLGTIDFIYRELVRVYPAMI